MEKSMSLSFTCASRGDTRVCACHMTRGEIGAVLALLLCKWSREDGTRIVKYGHLSTNQFGLRSHESDDLVKHDLILSYLPPLSPPPPPTIPPRITKCRSKQDRVRYRVILLPNHLRAYRNKTKSQFWQSHKPMINLKIKINHSTKGTFIHRNSDHNYITEE